MNHQVSGFNRRRLAVLTALVSVSFIGLFVYGLQNGYLYFASLMILFYLPAAILFHYVWTRGDPWSKASVIFVNCVALAFGIVLELVAVHLDFWTFYTDLDPLVGFSVGGIPVEEFIFYFGANLQLTLLYVGLRLKCDAAGWTSKRFWIWFNKKQDSGDLPSDEQIRRISIGVLGFLAAIIGVAVFRRFLSPAGAQSFRAPTGKKVRPIYIEGKWYPGWLVAIAPFAAVGLIWAKKTLKSINIPALLISLAINVALYLLFEYNAIMRGHWVYNEQRLIGWRLGGVIPFEQICLYMVSFLFLVPFLESVRCMLMDLSEAKSYVGPETHPRSLSISLYRDVLGASVDEALEV